MKSAAGRAFKNIDSKFRVGFTTINSINGAQPPCAAYQRFRYRTTNRMVRGFLCHHSQWFGTPLRDALSRAGKIYAHKLAGAADPMQYSCQQNFTIMTTDGLWNGNTTPTQLDGTTAVGNPDAAAPRPMYDGSSYTKTTRQNQQNTSTTYQNTTQLQALQLLRSTSTLQSVTSQLQSVTSQLQTRTATVTINPLEKRTSTNYGYSWTSWSDASASGCTVDYSGSHQTDCRGAVQRRNSTDYGATFGPWYDVSSCTPDTNGSNQHQCQPSTTTTWSSWVNTSSCTSSSTTECQYAASAPVNVSSCTVVAESASSPYTVGTATSCAYVDNAPVNVSSCTTIAKSASSPYTVGTATSCAYTAWSTQVNASSCTTVHNQPRPLIRWARRRNARVHGSG